MVVNDDDNDGVVMDHIAANKSFQVNSVNNDDDHDDNYDNLFRLASIISLLQTSFQAASTAVPFFTIQTHGKNTADFVFQVLIL